MIHVAYRLWGGDGYYAKMCGTSMLSMFENTREKVTVHIMHNERLTPDNRGKFCYIAGQYNQRVEFHNVEEIAGNTLRRIEEVHPIASGINASWYPLIVHEVFPDLDKIIFLGADTVFNLDVGELWAYDPEKQGFILGAVMESLSATPREALKITMDNIVVYENYFNADVLILKPKFFRENAENIINACKFIYDNGYILFEQDVLNYLFSEKYLKLPFKFNTFVSAVYIYRLHFGEAIYHYAGPTMKPNLNADDIFNNLYLKYFLKTPWANVDMFGNLQKALDKFLNEQKNLLLHMTNLLTWRQRAFFVESGNAVAVKNIFAIKDDELIIDASTSDAGKKLLDAMTKFKGQKIFFILAGNYFQIRWFLLNQKFVENVDFVNGFMFLSEQAGVKVSFDTKPLLQAL